jgi:hypothetical protein
VGRKPSSVNSAEDSQPLIAAQNQPLFSVAYDFSRYKSCAGYFSAAYGQNITTCAGDWRHGFFFWKNSSKPEQKTPDEEIESVISGGKVSAVKLAELADKFPQLLAKVLRDRRVIVTGVLQKVVVKGVGSNDLILDLAGSPQRKITFTSDVNSYTRANNLLGASKQKFQKIGRDIVVYENAAVTNQASASGGAIQKLLAGFMPSYTDG